MNVVERWDDAVRELSESDVTLGKIISKYGEEQLKLKSDEFLTLARAIVGQQISVKAADTIWKRLERTVKGNICSAEIRKLSIEELRKTGLSRQKTEYIQNIAESDVLGTDWNEYSDEEVTDLLCTIKGIGKWTAEMFLIFHLARPDVLPLSDVGLMRAIEMNYNGGNAMSRERFDELGQAWTPWRTVATWYLWRSLDPIPVEY
ncbi:MAG: DNA-3-methyladenine glycosylase 2 family protein [Candidatus Thermoplasmatota archaeon]|nr:DNA-3-methyladenine glycosylase 2 family protein [Candidatus Thermoplasmatota archaeon]